MACLGLGVSSQAFVPLVPVLDCYETNVISKRLSSVSPFSSPKSLFRVSYCNTGNRASAVKTQRGRAVLVRAAETMATEKSGIKIVKNPPESKLSELGVLSWPKWGCPPSKFPWTYSSKETCYLLKGKVKVYPDGWSDEDEAVEIGAGDLVVFPKGMSCTWDVSEAVDKHYNFE